MAYQHHPGLADRPSHPAPSRQHDTATPALDGFRAIAIIIVMLSHVGLSKVVPGQFGVTLFFFLSGYLITTLLRREWLRTGTISFKAFYLRRAIRILPPMYLAIALAVGLSVLGAIPPIDPGRLIYDLFFLSNYAGDSGLPIGLWSLAVEEHYYLIFPLFALIVVGRWGAESCALACLALCMVVLGVRHWEIAGLDDLSQVNFWSHTRMDSILFGAVLALWNNPVIDAEDRLPPALRAYAIGGALLAVTLLIRDEAFRQTVRYSIQGFGLLLIFNAAIRDRGLVGRFLNSAPLRFVAALSYSLYLLHSITLTATSSLAAILGTPLAHVLGIALAFVLAYLMSALMDQPLAQWRRGVERRWRANDAAARPVRAADRSGPARGAVPARLPLAQKAGVDR